MYNDKYLRPLQLENTLPSYSAGTHVHGCLPIYSIEKIIDKKAQRIKIHTKDKLP